MSQFQDKNIRILIDVGYIKSKFENENSLDKLKGEVLEIDGEKGQFSTFIYSDKDIKKRGFRKYTASIFFESTDVQSRKENLLQHYNFR